MNQFPAQGIYVVANGISSSSSLVEVFETRPPTTNDVNYPVQKRWLDTSTQNEYILVGFTSSQGILQANWINISNPTSGGGWLWIDVTLSTQTLQTGYGYLADNAGGVTFTLPSSSIYGNVFRIVGVQGSWTISQNANQQIKFGTQATTVGAAGSISSNDAGDCVECVATNSSASTVWRVMSSIGNITFA